MSTTLTPTSTSTPAPASASTPTQPGEIELPTIPRPPGATNTVLADLQHAIEDYPHTDLVLEIYDVNAPNGSINEGDNVTFKVRIHNDGPLYVDDLTITVQGLNGTVVGLHGEADTDYRTSLVSSVWEPVPAHQLDGVVTETPDDHYHFLAGPSGPPADLIKVWVSAWNTTFDHLTGGHSREDLEGNTVYHAKVFRA